MSGQGPERGQRGAGELAANVLRSLIVAPPAGVGAPAWVRRVLERGLAVEPWARWPTMDELLAALGRDPQRARRRWLAAATLVTAIAGAGYGAAVTRSVEAEVCSGASDALAAVWGADRRAAVELALRATGVVYAERAAVASGGLLDDFAGRWISAHTAACVSHRRGEMSAQLFDRKMACLRQRRAELAATAEVLAQTTRDSAAQAAAAALTASTPTIKEGAPDSTVRLARTEAQGALDPDIIRRVVRAHVNELRHCYNQALAHESEAHGRVAVQFVIGGVGKVTSAVFGESDMHGDLDRCVTRAVRRWSFPRPEGGGSVLVSYPFVFTPS